MGTNLKQQTLYTADGRRWRTMETHPTTNDKFVVCRELPNGHTAIWERTQLFTSDMDIPGAMKILSRHNKG